MHTDEEDEDDQEDEDVTKFRKVVNRRFSKLPLAQEDIMKSANKEMALEEKLREMHCRPMVKMFKFFNSP